MQIDFISLFKKFLHRNSYIYKLINFFSKHIYSYSSINISTNNVINLFNHYLQSNDKSYTMYINTSSYFISEKLYIYFY